MEVLSPFEGLDEGDWISSPRISFSQDFPFPGRCSPKMQFMDSPEEEFSFMFRSAENVDLPSDDSMLSADELFFNGRLRPLQEDANLHVGNGYLDVSGGLERRIEESPRCFSMTIESCRGEVRGGRAFMSLNNSRCSSPSRTMSMPHTTPTSPEFSSRLPLSSASSSEVTSSSVPSDWMMPTSLTSLEMSSSVMSSALSSSTSISSSKYSSKLKEFFKLKKGNISKDAAIPSLPFTSMSAEISRESVQASGSASCRQPSKSFWPFSRSNSAGESKTSPAVSPLPRRSNSAGEGKTTSSSLLPMNSPPSKQCTHRNAPAVASMKGLPASADSMNALSKKGLPPLPNSNARKANSFFVPVRCGRDSVALSSQSIPVQACTSSNRSVECGTSTIANDEPSFMSPCSAPDCTSESSMLSDERKPNGDIQLVVDVSSLARKGRSSTTASPGRPVRRGVHSNAARNFARGSPGRRGVWNSPGRGNGGRVSVRNLDRGSIPSKGHVRPKDMLNRDGASVRISPVLNVAVPSLRGTKASSKSTIFSLGNLFSKKERVTSLRTYNVLPPADSQNGL
ncbi:hypothetical protein GOP47_0015995 [Adiantum capillus-veneris]|uniref:Uncharacterized protein n=1 Tax=Adiantum capillus-veneris TaxID=13818 RepID=A0A9D4UKQ7_ADICA|nr:hypothetical protein GOP47_0015995 [Adiantum capillus-veneris]